ncbi:MBOAT family O-acyltransferase [Leptospira sp. GIMC2001]|uniref:MBOAT family O-acyltransferase n=1 Tax=Leptospira sp. GIMC2001 TaxID=1513297 RepID=UPI0023498681|nr:MBOAT family O-acyltransferase [Leptospira sp. GIMC2001]WCL49002.1 MBOAT family protein [Leptospira sp. GIMC2001]
MLFNSIPFLFFFAFVYLIYWSVPSTFRKKFLLIAGIVFYSLFSLSFAIHLLSIVGLNYILYRAIISKPDRKWPVTIAVLLNILNLAFFKYFYFVNQILADATGYPFFQEIPNIVHIALPMAISFYSFQMIAAAVDTKRTPPETTIPILDYYLFVVFFPVLIAGPIMRIKEFFPNLDKLSPDREKMYRAGYLMMSGLIKKVLVADPMSSTVSPIFADPGIYDSFSLFMAGICYSIQVFCDFSGLTDMARSVALFLGFEIPENFKAPFFATSGRELWRRWHITLSFWLREYIYIPLGGSRVSEWRGYFNLIITMTIGGIWHGADYTFVVWGFYWGVILASERALEDKYGLPLTPQKSLPLKVIKGFIVFILFSISGLMFRSNSAESMVVLFKGLFLHSKQLLVDKLFQQNAGWMVDLAELTGGKEIFRMEEIANLERVSYMFIALVIFHVIQYFPNLLDRFRKHDSYLMPTLGVITIFLLATLSQDGGEFIYFKF